MTPDLEIQHQSASCSLWSKEAPPGVVAIGAFEATTEQAAHALLAEAVQKAPELDPEAGRLVGPMDGNTWQRYRFAIGPWERPPYLMEPTNPKEWPSWWESAPGWLTEADYVTSHVSLTEPPARSFARIETRLTERDVSIRELDLARWNDELRAIHRISLCAFAANHLYTPLSEEAFLASYAPFADQVDPRFVLLAEHQNEVVGFVFAIPDLAATQRTGRPPTALIVKTLAVDAGHRFGGLGSLLVARVQQTARDLGFLESIHALQHETNSSRRISDRAGAGILRRYRLYQHPLPQS